MKNIFLLLTIILGTHINAQKLSYRIFAQGKQEIFFEESKGKITIKSNSVDEFGIHKGRLKIKTDSLNIRTKAVFMKIPTDSLYFFDISPVRKKYKKYRIISLDNLFAVYKNDTLVNFYDTQLTLRNKLVGFLW